MICASPIEETNISPSYKQHGSTNFFTVINSILLIIRLKQSYSYFSTKYEHKFKLMTDLRNIFLVICKPPFINLDFDTTPITGIFF